MSGREVIDPSQTRVSSRPSLENAYELGRGNAILKLQRVVQTLATSLVEALARLRDGLGGRGMVSKEVGWEIVVSKGII